MASAAGGSWPGAVSQTLGIDLASQPKETGVCVIEWRSDGGEVVELEKRMLDDDALLALMLDPAVSKVGIDAPLGWPLAFIDAISTYRDTGVWLELEANELRFRATETLIAEETGQAPLSVAVSDLAWPAMRCARLLSRLAEHHTLDRSGSGLVAEVYPMAALRRWGVIGTGTSSSEWSYKGQGPGRQERRSQHLARLRALLGDSLRMTDSYAEACVADDDDFDALISALVARAIDTGRTDPIPRGHKWAAIREGWIHLPTAESVSQLAG